MAERIAIETGVRWIGAGAFQGDAARLTIVMYADVVTLEGNSFSECGDAVIMCHRDSAAAQFAHQKHVPIQYMLDRSSGKLCIRLPAESEFLCHHEKLRRCEHRLSCCPEARRVMGAALEMREMDRTSSNET